MDRCRSESTDILRKKREIPKCLVNYIHAFRRYIVHLVRSLEQGRIQVFQNLKHQLEMPGIEPGASHMRSERSTTELHPLMIDNDTNNFTI